MIEPNNPIFIQYYSHEGCDCYKIKNPWPTYCEEIIVLCPVSEGLRKATMLARGVVNGKLNEALMGLVERK